jgi:pentatricopeptide repeat protein
MLPDGLQSLLEEFDGMSAEEQPDSPPPLELYDVANRILEHIEARQESVGGANDKALEMLAVSAEEANEALVIGASRGNKKYVQSLMTMMDTVNLPIFPGTVKSIVNSFAEFGLYEFASELFHTAVEMDVELDEKAWSSLVHVQALQGDIAGARETMERLKRAGVRPADEMYISVLNALVTHKHNDEAMQHWLDMKCEGVTLNVEAYNTMLQHSIQTYNPERAFWYLEEMKGSLRNLTPSLQSYAKLFRSLAEAPMWVNGFHDIIFDAMAIVEGAEVVANTEMYDSIIFAFGKAGDAAAAEYYFWEMREKGIEQTVTTYNNLFSALAR